MPSSSEPADQLSGPAQLVALLVESPNLDAFLTEATRLGAQLIRPNAACGITVRRDGQQAFTAAASNRLAAEIDELQYATGEGPCLHSLRHGVVVQVDDLASERRWDAFRAPAIAQGVISSLSLPLHVGEQTVAVLNLYSATPRAFDGPARQQAEAFAGQCAATLTLALRQAQHAQLEQQVNEAMAARSVIDQAIGILMAQQRCTAATAFDMLRAASQRRNRKLRDIAEDIILKVSGQPAQPPAPFRLAD
jgi:GAF domain-containing protein